MDDRINLKRLDTIDKKHLVLTRNNKNNLGYEAFFDDYATDLLTLSMFISEEDKKQLDNGSKLRVAYWIESYSNE